MKIKLLLSTVLLFTALAASAQFPSTSSNWNIPNVESAATNMNTVYSSNYGLHDMDGDGTPDLVDAKDNFSGSVWENGAQRYWKVYLNNGTAISATSIEWNVPNVESTAANMNVTGNNFYGLYDMNGDGKLDLVDCRDNFTNNVWVNGAQRYWKVYLNSGAGFNATSVEWNLPNVESAEADMNVALSAHYGLYDMNGDGKLDLVDTEDNFSSSVWTNGVQRYWKVYLNTGTSFNSSSIQWNLPNVESNASEMNVIGNGKYTLVDMNGDAKLDLVDAADNFTNEVWQNGVQRFWKVYINSGTGFSTTSLDWNLPNIESSAADMSAVFSSFYGVYDMNGDGRPDLVDTKDNFSGSVWTNGAQRYWKVYLNENNAFNSAEIQWNVPNVESAENDMNVFGNSFFAPIDFTGDGLVDLVDSRDNFSSSVWENGAQRYWKVYANTSVGFNDLSNDLSLSFYPNPSNGIVRIDLNEVSNASIAIYNSLGQIVFQETNLDKSIAVLDLSNWNPGIYVINIASGNKFYSGKLVKE